MSLRSWVTKLWRRCTKAPPCPRRGEYTASVTQIRVYMHPRPSHHIPQVSMYDIHRPGLTLRPRVDDAVMRVALPPSLALGRLFALGTRVLDEDLAFERPTAWGIVTRPMRMECSRLCEPPRLGDEVVASLHESATVPPTWGIYRVGDAGSHICAPPTDA